MRPDEQAAVGAARDLTDALNGFSERLDKAERRERHMSTVLASVAIALAVAVGILAWFQTRSNSDRIAADRAQQAAFQAQEHAACLSTNRARAEAIVLWDKVLPGAVPPGKLPLLEATVAKYFAPHNCR